MANKPRVRVKRVYDEPSRLDGTRVLVDRIWPRGISKQRAALAEWCKEVAPSTPLRNWYAHDPAKFDEFSRRYRAELDQPAQAAAMKHLRELAVGDTLTLLTATRRAEISEAAVLVDLIREGPVPQRSDTPAGRT